MQGYRFQFGVYIFLLLFCFACAPNQHNQLTNQTSNQTTPESARGQLAVSEAGEIAFVLRGREYLLEKSTDKNVLREIPTPSIVGTTAWVNDVQNKNALWLSLPKSNLVTRVLGVPSSLNLNCIPLQLGVRHIFCHDGMVYDFQGNTIGRLPNKTSDVLDSNGRSFALVGLNIYEIGMAVKLDSKSEKTDVQKKFLFLDNGNPKTSQWPSAQLNDINQYFLQDGLIQMQHNETVLAKHAVPKAYALAANSGIVAVLSANTLWVFDQNLKLLQNISLEGLQ